MNILLAPFINALIGFYHLLGNFGWAVIIVTILIRLLLLPLVLPTLKASKKMMLIQPKLKKIQDQFKDNKQALATAQMELYKKEGINPLAGCLPQILQIVILVVFFMAFNMIVNFSMGQGDLVTLNKNLIPAFQLSEKTQVNLNFFGSDLAKTPKMIAQNGWNFNMLIPLILLIGSAGFQYLSSKLMMPTAAKKTPIDQSAYVKATPDKSDDMMEAMRTQSLIMMPLMTIILGWNFNLGILLYWFINSLVMLVQQVIIEKNG